MSITARLALAGITCCAGVWLVVSGLLAPRPALVRMISHLGRGPNPPTRRVHLPGETTRHQLLLIDRQPEAHAALLIGSAVIGLFGPALVVVLGQLGGLWGRDVLVPVGIGVVGAGLAPAVVQSATRRAAVAAAHDLRHQLSAYLDVVTMLLAGNVGNEGALRQAALAGDGRLFDELRRRILAAETSNKSLVSALASLGDDFQLVELQQISASAALGSVAGAPVARSLAAKCATLRATLAAEQETEARVRTGRITVPLVGMSLLIMTAVIYPALQL